MTDGEKLLYAVGNIDDESVLEAREYYSGRHRLARWGALAACCCIIAGAALFMILRGNANAPAGPLPVAEDQRVETAPENIGRPDIAFEPGQSGYSNLPASSEILLKPLKLNETQAPEPVTIHQIALMGGETMTLEQAEEYFGVKLVLPETLSYLSLMPKKEGYCVYRRESREVYFDCNAFSFSDGAARSVNITLAKVFKHPYDFASFTGESIKFTSVNGRELAVFSFTSDGDSVFYTEFLQNGTGYYIEARNIPQDDFYTFLCSIVKTKELAVGGVRSFTATVSGIDVNADIIMLDLDPGTDPEGRIGISVQLPEGKASSFSRGDRVKVSFTGEPATVQQILKQQFYGIEKIG